jgi:hypothetical protein
VCPPCSQLPDLLKRAVPVIVRTFASNPDRALGEPPR